MIVHIETGGRGLMNKVLNKIPVELHLPGYQYCGPGTKLAKRLARGDQGINPLDQACREHDIAYSQNRENVEARNLADRVLADKAEKRVGAKDAKFGEKIAAYAVSKAMKIKSRLGMGIQRRRRRRNTTRRMKKKKPATKLNAIVKAASKAKGSTARTMIASALKRARQAVQRAGGKNKVIVPRVLPLPNKVGGVIPFLIPLFAGLSAVGAMAGGAAGIAKAVNDSKAAKDQLEESRRHNKAMEDISVGKGLCLKATKTGLGLHLKPYRGSSLKGQKKKTSR